MAIITIDGNIGSGKTSVLNYLHKYHKIPIDLEPVESWNTYLSKLYDEKMDVFKFQVRVWLDRCWIQEKSEKTLILIERSPYYIKNSFIETAHTCGMITDLEHEMLIELHSKTDSLWATHNMYIYLRSNPENCHKRIKKRNRQSEKSITQEYIQILHDSHEDTYQKALNDKMNIIVIDVDDKAINEVANEIMEYIHQNIRE